ALVPDQPARLADCGLKFQIDHNSPLTVTHGISLMQSYRPVRSLENECCQAPNEFAALQIHQESRFGSCNVPPPERNDDFPAKSAVVRPETRHHPARAR